MADVTYIPDQNQANSYLPWMLAGQNNGGLFGGYGGSAFWGALLGSIVPGIFGGWNGGFGGFGGGSGAAAASLGAQATANNNAGLILNAINGTDADVRLLATTLNTDVDSLKLGINTVQGAIAQVASQVGMSGLQVVNAIQAGNADLASRLCSCCCEMKQLVTSQGYENQIATLNQTNQLGSQADRNARSITDAINAQSVMIADKFCEVKERELQGKIDTQAEIITQLRNQADNAAQTAAFAAMLAPINAKLVEIESKQPNTIPVQYPNVQAVTTTPYMGGFYGAGYGFGYGVPGGSYWG